MKTILLNFAHRPSEDPTRYTVVTDCDTCVVVRSQGTRRWPAEEMILTKQANGTLRNVHGCEFVVVKADRRPKPYTVLAEGIDGSWSRKFATLVELQAWIRDRWQGADYIDGPDGWHDDYVRFTLLGATLQDLGQRDPADFWTWTWKAL